MNKLGTIPYVEMPGDQSGARTEDGRHLMPNIVDDFRDMLLDKTGINLQPTAMDISAETRYEQIARGTADEYFAQIGEEIAATGVSLKFPTETSKAHQVKGRLTQMRADEANAGLEFDEEDPAYRRSPNDILRTALEACSIVRDHEPISSLYLPPEIAHIEVMSPDDDFMVLDEDGTVYRQITEKQLANFADRVVHRALESGKGILILSKSTISPFEAMFEKAIHDAATRSNVKVEAKLSDSQLARVVRGDFEDVVLATFPDNADRFAQIGLSSYLKHTETTVAMNPMRVYRCATGFGYGETMSNKDGLVRETYTMDPVAVRDNARLAQADAQRMGVDQITVILPHPEKENPVNEKFKALVEEHIDNPVYYTCGRLFGELTRFESSPKHRIVVCGNSDGDHITDLMPALQVPKLGGAILGVGESRVISVDPDDPNLRIVKWMAEASAGTAVPLAEAERNNEILGAGLLLSICRILTEHPDFEDCQEVGTYMHDAIMDVLQETGDGRKDWSGLVEEVGVKYDKLSQKH